VLRPSCFVILALVPATAGATYSICGTDTASRQVGGSGTSCVAPGSVYIIYGTAPGHGVVHAQALIGGPGKDEAVNELNMDIPPADIIVNITDPVFDPAFSVRQYGIADLMGRAAGFTGINTQMYTEDRQGIVATFPYSVQGNILTSVAVIDNAEDSFVNGGGCDLADRLMLALEGGELNGEGDSRCTPDGIPANSAFIEVDREGEPAQSWLYLEFTDPDPSTPENPITALRSMYDAWRLTNPCPPQPDGGMMMDAGLDGAGADVGGNLDAGPAMDIGGGSDLGAPLDMGAPLDTGVPLDTGAGADSGLPPDAGTGADIGPGTDGAVTPDSGAQDHTDDLGADPDAPPVADAPSPSEDGADAPSDTAASEAGGCACRAGGTPARFVPLWLVLGLLARRRRR